MSRKKLIIIIISIVIVLIILIAFFAPGILGIAIPDKSDFDSTSFKDRMEKYVEKIQSINNEIEDPLIPMFFHYLNRYFSGYNEDQIDEAFKENLSFRDPLYYEILEQALEEYNNNKEILEPIIPQEYYNLDIGQKLDLFGAYGFLNRTLDYGQALEASLKGGIYLCEVPGKIRWVNQTKLNPQLRVTNSEPVQASAQTIQRIQYNLVPEREVFVTEPFIHHITYSDGSSYQKTVEVTHISNSSGNLEATKEQTEKAPTIIPGTEVTLTGANFYNKELTIQIWSNLQNAPLNIINMPGWVMGDPNTPVLDNQWNWDDVQDKVWFKLPHLEPGYYAITIYEDAVDDPSLPPLLVQTKTSRNPIIFYVPPPKNQKYIIQLYEVHCVDETKPETFLGVDLSDDLFAYFAVTTGTQQPWPVEVFYEENYRTYELPNGRKIRLQKPLEGDDRHTEYINEYKDGWLFGRERKPGIVDGTVSILFNMLESDTGEAEIAKELVSNLIDIGEDIASSLGAPGLVVMAVAYILEFLIGALIDWICGPIIVAQDLIIFTEDELFFLTAIENRMAMEDSQHYISQKTRTRDGIDVWNGEYGFEELAFWEWRCYKNNDEPSEYWIKIRVQRIHEKETG